MSKKRVLAGIMSLLLLITSVFTGNVVTAKADDTAGQIAVTITGNGTLDYTFFDNSDNQCNAGGAGQIKYDSENKVIQIPSDAVKMTLKAYADQNWQSDSASGTMNGNTLSAVDNGIFGEAGITIDSFTVGDGFSLTLNFREQQQQSGLDIPAGSVGFEINNSQNGKVYYSFTGTEDSWEEIGNNGIIDNSTIGTNTTIYVKAVPNSEQSVDSTNGANYVDIAGNRTNFAAAELTEAGVSFTYSSANAHKVHIEFAGNGGGQQPSANAGDIAISIQNCQNGTVKYKVGDNNWQEISGTGSFTLRASNELNGVANGTTIWFQAVPNSEQSLDTNQGQNWIQIGGNPQTDISTEQLLAGTYSITYDPASTYSMQIKFNGGGEPSAANAGDIAIAVNNAQGTSAAYYRIGDSGNFTKIEGSSLTLSASGELQSVALGTKIYFKADIDSSQTLDEHNQNWYRADGAETQFELNNLADGSAYLEYDSSKTYNVQIAFDGGGNNNNQQQDVSFSCTSMNGNENERVDAVEVSLDGGSNWVDYYNTNVLDSLTEGTTFKVRIRMKNGFTIDKVSLDYESFDHNSRVGYFKESEQPNYDAIIQELLSDAGYAITFQPEEDSKDGDNNSTLQASSTCLKLQYQTAIAYDESVNINWFFQIKDGDNGYGVWTRAENGDDVFVDGVGDSEVIFSFNDNNYGENGDPFDLGYGVDNANATTPIQVSYDSAYKNVTGKVAVTPDTYDSFSAGGYASGSNKNTIHLDDYDGLIDAVYIDFDRDGYFEESEKLTAKDGDDPYIGPYFYYEETLDAAASYNILVRKHLSTRVSLKWSYTESGTDFYVDHGKIFIEKVVRGDQTLFEAEKDTNGDLVLNEQGVPNTTTDLLGSDYGVSSSAGEVLLECGDKVTIRLIPTYGYQIESATLNGCVQLTPNETVSSFTFTVGGNLHMAGTFVEATDEIDTSDATKIDSAGIADGGNATDSGNLKLTVADHSGTYAKESEALNLAKGENANATTIATLDMTLDSMVSKGNGQYWTDNITSFTYDINVNLELNDTTYEPGDTYVVVREHDGQLDKLTTTYSNGMLEVPTNKFSTYSIVKIPVAAEDRPNMYLEYDPRGEGDEAGTVTVKCNGAELTGTDGYYKYSNPAQEITFELKRPADRTDTGKYTPVVDVVFPQEGEEPVIKYPTVTDNKFTVTPSTDSGLTGSPFMEVYVHWSEYDSVGPDEDQFMVILRKYSDADSFVFQNNPTVQRTASLDDETKYIFANGTNVSVEIQPGENRELVEVYVDTSGQLTHYSAEPQEGDRDIAELKTSDGKFVVSNLAPWTMVEAICIDLPVLSNIQLTNTSQTLYDTMKRSEVGISATCTLGGVPLTGTVELDGGNELLTVGENEYKVIFTSNPINEQGERIYAEGAITLKVLHQVDISGLGWTGTTFTYNGTAQGPTFNCNLQNVRVSSTRGNSEVNVAEYTAVASVTLAEGLSTEYYKLVNPSGTTGITITENGAIATVTQSWSITAKDLASAEITLGDALTYNGATQTQTIASVKVDGRTLTAGTDYEVSGNTGTNANTYTLTITGQGNYTGTATKDWSIGKKSITGATITLGATLTYDGTTQTQTISSVVIGDKTLTASDYTISGNEQKDAGTYTLTVEGTGNYTGTATKQFTIEKATLTPALSGTTAKVYDNTTAVTATNDLTLSVTGLKNSETVTVTAAAYAYDNANAGTGKTITATGITISGDAAKNYVLSVDTATVANGEITQATPTITLSNLSETTQAPTGAKATLTPADASAAVVVEYKVVDTPAVVATPGVPCNVTHEDTCASKQEGNTIEDCNCRVKTHIHDEECGYKAATSGTPTTYKWVNTRPTTPGTYEVRAYLPTGTTNVAAIAVENAVTGSYTLTQYTAPTGDNTSNNTGSSSSSGSTTTTPTTPATTTPATTTPEAPAATDTTTTKPATKKPVAQTEETVAGTTTGVTSEDGSSGWTDIENEISDKLEAALEAAGEGETETVEVVVEMNGEKKIPTDIFEAIKGQNIEVTFEMGDGIAWTVNGMDVTADKFDNISFGASTGSGVTAIPTELIAGIAGENFGMELTLEYEGEFGFTAVMTVNVDKKNVGKYANLFYFNPKTETMEFICSAPVKEDGTTDLTFTHASDYVIVVSDATMSAADNTSLEDVQGAESGDTSDEPATGEVTTDKKAWTPIWIIVIGAFVIIIGGIVLFAVKKKND